jgi:hypothetical protein
MKSQVDLAWALAQAESPQLRRADRNRIYAEIGAGETFSAISRLLTNAANRGFPLPMDLIWELRRWVNGYTGTRQGVRLRRLLDGVQAAKIEQPR